MFPLRGPRVERSGDGDGGASAVEYAALLALAGVLVAALWGAGVFDPMAEGVRQATCRLFRIDPCTPSDRPPVAARDPHEPLQPCTTLIDTHFLEETITIPTKRVDVRTSSRGTMQITRRVQGDGKPDIWEVTDFTWGEGGVATPNIGKSTVSSDGSGGRTGFKIAAWGGVILTNGNVYRFESEQEARDFYRRLEEHRIGGQVRFTLRTNPISGGPVWLLGKLPWVGDDIDEWFGGSEPDREPDLSYTDGGLTGGFNGEAEVPFVSLPFKGRGFWITGTRVDNTNGDHTVYFQDREEAELAVQIDLSAVWKRLPASARSQAAGGLDSALELALQEIERLLRDRFGPDFSIPTAQRSEIKAGIRINPDIGLNVKYRRARTFAYTEDRNGTPKALVETDSDQLVVYARASAKAKVDNGGDKADAGGNAQWILGGRRWIEEKTLDYADPEDRRIIDRYLAEGGGGHSTVVDDYFARGGGTRARLTYDNGGDTWKGSGTAETTSRKSKAKRKWGVVEIGDEQETNRLIEAEYFSPGKGWVKWDKCG